MNQFANVQCFVEQLQNKIDTILQENFVGSYIHGSLALGGFNEKSSDIDLLIVTKTALSFITIKQLAELFISVSNRPYPIEVSFLHQGQLKVWKYPCPYDFHYSEYWRERYTKDLLNNTSTYINQDYKTDKDLAAHITITNYRGICYKGKPIHDVFPSIPKSDYFDSILSDFYDCLENINQKPIYCILNLLRVFLFVKEGIISSKKEAGIWGSLNLPNHLKVTVDKAREAYKSNLESNIFTQSELIFFKRYISENIKDFL